MATAALGSAWLLSGCGGDPAPRPVPRGAAADIGTLTKLLEHKRRVERAYADLARLLPGDVRAFRAHEAEHVLALEQAMRDLGATPPPHAAAQVPPIRSRQRAAEFVAGLELRSLTGLLGAIPRVGSGDLRGTLAAAGTVDAEHVAVIGLALGAEPIFLGEGP